MENNVSQRRILIALAVALTVFSAVTGAIIAHQGLDHSAFRPEPTSSEEALISEINGVKYLGDGFTVKGFSEAVTKGDTATVTVSAESGARIAIEVYYASGKSSSAVFTPKTVSDDGEAVWEWRVPSNTSASEIRVVLRSEDTYATLGIAIK